MITLGGDAELELVDSLDPFSEGVVFSVRPPKKSWKHIANLSGGEKTLSSLALVFALHHYKPTPLYVMDEIDAALDFRNVSIVGNYIKERTRNAQFIIISLRNNMFERACCGSNHSSPQRRAYPPLPPAQLPHSPRPTVPPPRARSSLSMLSFSPCAVADRLVGIYKTNDCTKSVAINPSAFTMPTARVN